MPAFVLQVLQFLVNWALSEVSTQDAKDVLAMVFDTLSGWVSNLDRSATGPWKGIEDAVAQAFVTSCQAIAAALRAPSTTP